MTTITASSSGVGTLEETGASDGGSGERTSVAEDVFIRSFVFHPDLPIRVDYEGKRFNMMAVVRTGTQGWVGKTP